MEGDELTSNLSPNWLETEKLLKTLEDWNEILRKEAPDLLESLP